MKQVLTLLTQTAVIAKRDAETREACAASCERDGDPARAENLRAQAALDRELLAECQEVIQILQILATVKQSLVGLTEDELEQAKRSLVSAAAEAIA